MIVLLINLRINIAPIPINALRHSNSRRAGKTRFPIILAKFPVFVIKLTAVALNIDII